MDECKKEDVPLFHVTHSDYLDSISRQGLKTDEAQLEELRELYVQFHNAERESFMEAFPDDPDPPPAVTHNDAVEAIPRPIIFATDDEGVVNLSLIEDHPSPIIIGIKYTKYFECADLFWKEEINSSEDWITNVDVPPECLCIVKKWD